MFQGSRSVRSGEHFEALMAEGARLNATTWFDRTNYFETVPTGAFELALWLEADRHGHLLDAVTQENLDNQRDVVKEEKRQRYDNQPYGNALIDVYAAVFPQGHPYHHPTIGSMEDLDAASLDDVHAFFRAHYGPDNTVLTLCGDVTAEHGFALVERYFGDLPASGGRAGPTTRSSRRSTEPVRVERHEVVPNDRLHVAFRLPVDETDDFIAAAVALDCIGGLATSRLVRRLVRREQTASAPTPPRGASSTAPRWASSSSTSRRAPTPTSSRPPSSRSSRASSSTAPPTSSSRPRWPSPSGPGSPPWPARRSAPTWSATTCCSTTTRTSSTPTSTGCATSPPSRCSPPHGAGCGRTAGRRRLPGRRRRVGCRPTTEDVA